jgi:hypothetical protein
MDVSTYLLPFFNTVIILPAKRLYHSDGEAASGTAQGNGTGNPEKDGGVEHALAR